jgi:multisubunit Na+/H+ antiporter MnhE subunit
VRQFAQWSELALWWALMVGVWDLTLSGTTLPDILAAVAAGLLSAAAAVASRRLIGGRWTPPPAWARWLPVIAVKAVTDTARAFSLASRHLVRRDVDTSCGEVALRRGPEREVAIHEALASLAITSTPGSVVYDQDSDGNRLFKHELVSGPPDLERVVAR